MFCYIRMGKKNRTHRKKRKYSGGKFGLGLMNRFGRGAGMEQQEYANPYDQQQTPYIVDNTREDANMFNMMDATPQFKKPNISKALGTLGITQNEYLNQQMPQQPPPGKMGNQRNTKKNFFSFLGKSASNTMRKAASKFIPKFSLPAEVVEQIKYVIDNVEELRRMNLPVDEILNKIEIFLQDISKDLISNQLTISILKNKIKNLLIELKPKLNDNSNNFDLNEIVDIFLDNIDNIDELRKVLQLEDNDIIEFKNISNLINNIPFLLKTYKEILNIKHKDRYIELINKIENKIREIQSKYSQIINNQETNKLIGIASKIPGAEGIVNMAIESQQNPMMPPMPPSRDEDCLLYTSPSPRD